MNYICHHTDNDGYCAATIIYYWLIENKTKDDTKLIPCNYGFDFTKFINNLKQGDYVYIVDFSFEVKDFKRIVDKVTGKGWNKKDTPTNIFWIDHHDSAIQKYKEADITDQIQGLRSINASGCELAYIWCHSDIETLYPDENKDYGYTFSDGTPVKTTDDVIKLIREDNNFFHIPDGIRYVGDWDTWTFKYGDNTKAFNAGTKLYDTRKMLFWKNIIGYSHPVPPKADDLITEGKLVLKYESNLYNRMCHHGSFEFTDSKGRSWIALNSAIHSSKVFGEEAEEKYDFMMVFSNCHNDFWTYSIYSKKHDTREVNFAGYHSEGHKGASGFETETCIITKDICNRIS